MADNGRRPLWAINRRLINSVTRKPRSFGLTSPHWIIKNTEVAGIVAQLEERLLHTQEVIGSRPVGPIWNESIAEPASAGFFIL